MEPRALAREMRQVLAELELLSHGKTQSFNSSAKGESDNPVPFGESKPAHEDYAELFRQAQTEEDCQAILDEAREFLESWKGRNRAQQAQEWDEERWIIEDGEGFEAVEVARRFNTNVGRVRKLRLSKGREADYGMPYVAPEPEDMDAKVLDLVGRGLSTRAIELITKVPKSQVQRIKQRAA